MFEATMLFVAMAATIASSNNKFEDYVMSAKIQGLCVSFEG
jgi:hypothetical protein